MVLKRTMMHLDGDDLAALAALAEKMSKETGLRVTTSGLVRQAIKELLHSRQAKRPARTRKGRKAP